MKRFILFLVLCLTCTVAMPQAMKGIGATTKKKVSEKDHPVVVAKKDKGGKTSSSSASKQKQNTKPSNQSSGSRGQSSSSASSGYMNITSLVFANVDYDGNIIDDFGSKLYVSDLRYLKPKVRFRGLGNVDRDVDIDIKIFDGDGELETYSSSPDGYTYEDQVSVTPGVSSEEYLRGWGSKSGGSFSAGLYRYEIWYNNKKLYQQNVRLYPGSAPMGESNILRINRVAFGSVDEEGNQNVDFGSTLYSGDVKWLNARMYYTGLNSSERNVTLYYRIFDTSGKLKTVDTSPSGFSNSTTLTIKPGDNFVTIPGLGNKLGKGYEPGNVRVEYWIGGEKLYETTLEIKKKLGSTTYLTVDSKTAVSTSFSSTGGSENFYVKTDAGDWDVWGVPSWCEVNKYTSSFSLKCKPNTGSTRTDYLLVKAGDKSVRLDIKQF